MLRCIFCVSTMSAFEHLHHRAAERRRRIGDRDAGPLHRLYLVAGRAAAAGYNRAGMAHASARRRGGPGDEAHHRLLDLAAFDELRRLLLGRAADLADHDDRLGLVVLEEELEAIDEIGAVDGVAADPHAARLTEAGSGGLRHRLIGQGARARHDADIALGMDVPGHDADLALLGRDDAGTVGADQPALRAAERALHRHHVEHGNSFGDADDERHAGIDRLEDGVGREGRRHIDGGGRSAGLAHRLADRVEDRKVEMLAAAFAGRHAADHLGPVGDRLLGMEGALGAGETLADHLGVGIDQDGHQAASFTALTTFSAASARLSAERMGRPDSLNIFLPSRTLVPSRRTTSGTCSATSRAAATMPSAMTSQRMMPPKMLTRMPSTLASERMSLKAVVTRSLVAPPPTSRKLAGSPP